MGSVPVRVVPVGGVPVACVTEEERASRGGTRKRMSTMSKCSSTRVHQEGCAPAGVPGEGALRQDALQKGVSKLLLFLLNPKLFDILPMKETCRFVPSIRTLCFRVQGWSLTEFCRCEYLLVRAEQNVQNWQQFQDESFLDTALEECETARAICQRKNFQEMMSFGDAELQEIKLHLGQ